MYYYFKKRANVIVDIVSFDHQINLLLNKWYQPLTQEQVDFYLQNPSASIQEVINCQLTPPYVPPTPDVQEYASMRVKELKDACYASVTITSLEYAVAEDKVNNVLADSYYSLTEANRVLSDFRTQSKKALTVINTYTPRIEAASTIEEVNTIYNQAIEAL